eukprot:1102927-Rhodomonas_salina.3
MSWLALVWLAELWWWVVRSWLWAQPLNSWVPSIPHSSHTAPSCPDTARVCCTLCACHMSGCTRHPIALLRTARTPHP